MRALEFRHPKCRTPSPLSSVLVREAGRPTTLSGVLGINGIAAEELDQRTLMGKERRWTSD
jgi:hypothetical protein